MIASVTSVHNPTIKLIRSLKEKKFRTQSGLFVAEGEMVLARAKTEGWEPEFLVSTEWVEPWGTAQLVTVSPKVMGLLSAQYNPPPVLGVFGQRWHREARPDGLWLALEDIRDPGNLGTMLRTADAVSARGVILGGDSCDPWGPDCVRASMGSIFGVPLVRMDTPALISLCKSWPGDAVGTHLQATEDFRRRYADPVLLVMGSEGTGLSSGLAAACRHLVRIPMKGDAQSLNVAVATGIMLYEIVKV